MSGPVVALGNREDENHCRRGAYLLLREAGNKHNVYIKGIVRHMEIGARVK